MSQTPDLSQARYGTLLRLLWTHIAPQRQMQLLGLLLLMLLSSFAELLSVASIVPFLAVLSDPQALWRFPWLRGAAQGVGITSAQGLIAPIALLLMAAGLGSAAIRAANLFVNVRLSAVIAGDLSVEGYRRTLEQPYPVHLSRNSSEVITRLAYLAGLSRGILAPLLQGLSGLIVALVLLAGLLFYQPGLAAGLSSVFLLSYSTIARLNRRRLHRISVLSDHFSQLSLQAQQEGIGAIRDVLLDSNQDLFVEAYRKAQVPLMLLQSEAEAVAGLPRFLLEGLGMVAIASSVLWLLPRGGVVSALPAVGAIALGFQRLLPAVQQMYAASTYLGTYRDVLAGGLELLEQQDVRASLRLPAQPVLLPFEQKLEFRDVDFWHNPGTPILQEIDFIVRPGEWIGVVGATGSGKSTLLDLLMGLLSPSRGSLLVDGLPLEEPERFIDRRTAWQRHLAHVPQTIFLADATIASNIAFGVPTEQIDHQRLTWAAASAQAETFIMDLPQGFETRVGERGIRLSGGQRQRLGIARALYKQADVLILDEATSALDTVTEKRVIDAIAGMGAEYTVFMIAHRLSTVTKCHRILELQAGRLKAQGTYNDMLRLSPSFRQLSRSSQN